MLLRQNFVIEILHVPNTGMIIFFEALRSPSPKRPLTAEITLWPLEMCSRCHPFSNSPHNYFLYLVIGERILSFLKSNCTLLSRHFEFCKAGRSTLHNINTTPIEPKTERGCSRRRLFRHYCGSAWQRNNRQNREPLLKRYLLTLF